MATVNTRPNIKFRVCADFGDQGDRLVEERVLLDYVHALLDAGCPSSKIHVTIYSYLNSDPEGVFQL